MAANDRQEGGQHYQGQNLQHWDLAIMYGWDPFQYQITKYVMRWKNKYSSPEKRLEDLKKARHFLDKYIENVNVYDRKIVKKEEIPMTSHTEPRNVDSFWSCEGFLGDGRNVYQCRLCKHEERVLSLVEAYINHPDCSRAHAMFAAP